MSKEIALFWFRRDLRLNDNAALHHCLQSGKEVLPMFIFDTNILDSLSTADPRVNFIYDCLFEIDTKLKKEGASLYVHRGKPLETFKKLVNEYKITAVYCNKDYEPYAHIRDREIQDFLSEKGVAFHAFKDQVIFEENEVTKPDGLPYTVFTPYKKKWLARLKENPFKTFASTPLFSGFLKNVKPFPTRESIGIQPSEIAVKPCNLDVITNYKEKRDFPAKDATSYVSPYLRFGKVSIRQLVNTALSENDTFLSELIWREFFMQILFHFPRVVTENFKPQYDGIEWRNDEAEFEKWCIGKTGYPMVDAGMRQLNKTGYMHNRVRMVVASFLCKHLLIDWRWGEAYFAGKLLDFELSSNNGNWQWAAGTGCDAAPYFRVFNPTEQVKKFDRGLEYIRKWVPDFDEFTYPQPIVDHKMARERAIAIYKTGLEKFRAN